MDFTEANPAHPADWRWRRAMFRVETKSRRQLGADDEWARRPKFTFNLIGRGKLAPFEAIQKSLPPTGSRANNQPMRV